MSYIPEILFRQDQLKEKINDIVSDYNENLYYDEYNQNWVIEELERLSRNDGYVFTSDVGIFNTITINKTQPEFSVHNKIMREIFYMYGIEYHTIN